MAAGRKISAEDRHRIEAAVKSAEAMSGMQFVVFFASSRRDPQKAAEKLLKKLGFTQAPGAIVVVSARHRKVEIKTSEQAKARISDASCEQAVEAMVPSFKEHDWVTGIEKGLSELARSAGPAPEGATSGPDLPDILG